MIYKKHFQLLKSLPKKLNTFFQKKSFSSLNVKNKSKSLKDYDPVTNFDRNFEKFIRKIIKNKFPNDGIIGEEFPHKQSKNSFSWSIDPIDGTRAFVIGAPTWSNLVSLSYKGFSKIGLANFPDLDKFYINDDKMSYVVKRNKKKVLKCSLEKNIKKIKMIGNFHGTLTYERQRNVIKKFGWTFRLAGFDALNYCLLAEGRVDAVIEANLKPYDIMPLIPIIRKSGGIVTTWNNGVPEGGGNIIASSNIVLHKKILKILKPFTKK